MYSHLSIWARQVRGYYPKKAFAHMSGLATPTEGDIESFMQVYVFENIPFFCRDYPLAFDYFRRFIGNRLGVRARDIYLTGSGKLGFSLSPSKRLACYDPQRSDLDIFIISESLFHRLQDDLVQWEQEYSLRDDKSSLETKRISDCRRTARRGFLDTKWMERFPTVDKCHKTVVSAIWRLNNAVNKEIVSNKRKNFIRCYDNYRSARSQIKRSMHASVGKFLAGECQSSR